MNTLRLLLLTPLGQLALRWTVLLVLAWLADGLLRHGHPRRRLILWRGVLVLGCLLPLVALVPVRVLQIDGGTASAAIQAPVISSAPASMRAEFPTRSDSIPALRMAEGLAMRVSATAGIALVWTVGAIVGGIRLLRIQRRLARLRRNATEPDSDLLTAAREVQARLGVRRSVSVRVSAEATSPFVSGLWHPVIIVPAELLRNLAPAQVPALLSHEMAHLRSRDLAWCVAWRWVKTLGWPHPLLWRAPASHNLACEQEAIGSRRTNGTIAASMPACWRSSPFGSWSCRPSKRPCP